MKKIILILLFILFSSSGLFILKSYADTGAPSSMINVTYNPVTKQLSASGNYSWSTCKSTNVKKYVGFALFKDGGIPNNNDSNALYGSGMKIANNDQPCLNATGPWSDTITLNQAPTSVCVAIYDVEKSNGQYIQTGNHSITGAGPTRNGDNSYNENSNTYSSISCAPPTILTPECDQGLIYGLCTNAPTNTCSTNNGTQTITYTTYSGGGNCLQKTTYNNQCTIDNCSFSYVCSTGQCVQKFTLSGTIFTDTNGNGVKDSGETGAGVYTLSLSTGLTVQTDANGNYSIPNLSQGQYTITVSIPNSFITTSTNPVSFNLTGNQTINFGIMSDPTPTPSIEPTPTPSLTPSPTPIPHDTILSFIVGLDGIGSTGDNANPNPYGLNGTGSNQNPLNPTRALTVKVFDTNNVQVAETTEDMVYNSQTGKFEGTVGLGSAFQSGIYTVKIVTQAHLVRLIPGVQHITTQQVNNMPQVNLVAGDVKIDNTLSILDYNILLSCSVFSKDSSALCNSDERFSSLSDLEDNGVVDQFDYNLFVREYSVQNGQ